MQGDPPIASVLVEGVVLETLLWWLTAEVIGLVALPITIRWLRPLADRGYAASKILGLLLVGYLLWIAGVLRLLPNSRGSVLLILFGLAVVSLVLYGRRRGEIAGFLRAHRRTILASEVVFAVSFLGMALLRAYNPEILGTEKPMDFAFLNAALRGTHFPPPDPWLSGHSISYYYFGHVLFAAVIKLAGTPSAVGYNLSLALIYALAASGVFGLVYGLVHDARSEGGAVAAGARTGRTDRVAIAFGLVGVSLVLLIGNLEGVLELARAHGWGSADLWRWFGIRDLVAGRLSATWYPDDPWWWWRATRVIGNPASGPAGDYTITEFPFFSFLLGDLHPHVMALPFGVLALTLGYSATRLAEPPNMRWVRRNLWHVLLAGVCLGAFLFLNTWDFPTYFAVFAAGLLIAAQRGGRRWLLDPANLRDAAPGIAAVGVTALALYAPFLLSFQSQASGIVPLQQVRTWPVHFALVMGFPVFLSASYLVARLGATLLPGRVGWSRLLLAAPVALVPYALWLVLLTRVQSGPGEVVVRLAQVFPALLLIAAGIFLLDRRTSKLDAPGAALRGPDAFAVLLLSTGFLLLVLCELVFIKDVFGNRMNTVFKLYYQAWLLLAIASAYGLYWVSARRHTAPPVGRLAVYGWLSVVLAMSLASLVYPVTSVFAKTGGFRANPTLDGLAYVRTANPDEYEAMSWLASNAPEDAVVVEATGGQYSEFGRISARTGIPTLLGWAGHERQWRGSDRDFQGRDREIDAIYTVNDPAAVRAVLQQRQATFVFVGPLERGRYGEEVTARLASIMDVAFRKGGATVFKVR